MGIHLHWANLLTIVLYMASVVFIGAWFSRREENTEEYLLGGRRMPWWAVGISYMMSLLSTVSLVMVPGEIYNHGLSLYILAPLYPLTSILMFYVFVRFYYKLRVFTPFSYLERRYGPGVRLLISILYLWTRLIYLGMVIFSSSMVFEGAAGWPAWLTILLVGIIGITYTVLGGMKAVIWTDVVQFGALFFGLLFTIAFCAHYVAGGLWGGITYSIKAGHGADMYTKPEFYALNPYVRLCFWILLLGKFTEPLFYSTADQISVQRLLSTSSFKNGLRAMIVNAVAGIPFMLMMWTIGLIIFAYYAQNPDPLVTKGDTAFFTFVSTKLPPPIPGLMLAAMLAAVMSTLDSGMNSLSAVGLKDLYLQYWNKEASEREQVKVARMFTVVIGVLAMSLALFITLSSEYLRESVVEAGVIWGALGAVVAPVFLVGFTTRRVNSTTIWVATLVTWGTNFGMVTWYVASKSGLIAPIPFVFVLAPLLLAAAPIALALIRAKSETKGFAEKENLKNPLSEIRNPKSEILFHSMILWAMFPAGYALAIGFWWVSSHILGGGQLSFQWVGFPGLLVFLGLTYGSVILCRKIDEKQTAGLTLWSQDEAVAELNGMRDQ